MRISFSPYRSATCAFPLLLAACGGGSDSGSAGPPAEGVYGGSLSGNTTASAFQMVVLEDGSYWALYGANSANVFVVSGFVQGLGSSNNGSFSGDSRDFGFLPAAAGSVSAQYTATPTIVGAITTGTRVVNFNGGAIANSAYVYAKPALLTDITGSWSLKLSNGETLPITVSSTGAITGTSSGGCRITATAIPRPSGKNIFNVALTFGAAPCALPGQSANGIAITYPLSTGGDQLGVAVIDSARALGLVGFAKR